jgi:ferric-dicitrate binding protein FerR (iron transport regulator)
MSLFKNNSDLLDQAASQMADEPIDPRQVEAAAARVWARLSQEAAGSLVTAPVAAPVNQTAVAPPPAVHAAGGLHGCDDFQALIPAYLRGELSPARALLVEDHTRNCIPCRRALRDAREAHPAQPARPVRAASNPRRNRAVWISLAAVLAVALGFGLFTLIQEMMIGGTKMARIEAVEGTLYRVAGDSSRPITAGETIDAGEEVRTAKGSTALVRMADGSLIEMNERAGLSLDAARKGNTIQLERGRIIVKAAKQHDRHLFVATRDAEVSVVGTIFAVNSGTKGSRVSVVQGEVHVQQGAKLAVLHSGDQMTTHSSVERVSVKSEVAWSRNAKDYDQLLAELTALGKDIDAQVARPGLRTSTQLLDLAPAGTTVWIALPNLTKSLAETQKILDERITESPSLAQWWTQTLQSTDSEQEFHALIEKLGALGQNLGDEIAVAMNAGAGSKGTPVLLAQVTDEAAFRATVAQQIAASGQGKVQIVDDPATAPEGTAMLLWIHNGLLVASPSGAELRTVGAVIAGGANPFKSTPFYTRIAQDYQEGAGWLFAADLHTLVANGEAGKTPDQQQMAEKLGIYDLDQFIIDRRETDGHAETRAALTFDQTRRGIAAWLAAPAPMGSLSFFSPDANFVSAFVVKSPVSILDEMLSIKPDLAQELADAQAKHGFDLRNDLLAPLGGELAMGVDGPLLPTPSWKLVAEVYDPARLQQTFAKAVTELDAELKAHGKPGVQLTSQQAGGRTYYTIGSADAKVSISYLFEDGYLIAGPSQALIQQALQLRDSGVTLATTAKFRDLLGPDGQVNVSALMYSNIAPIAQSASKVLPSGTNRGGKHGPAQLGKLLAGQGPTLYYAYAEPDRIVFAGSNQNPLGLNLGTLASFGGLLGGMHQAQQAAGQ